MAKYKMSIAGTDSNDLATYDKLAEAAKAQGFDAMWMGFLAEHTLDQEQADPDDSWLRFSAGCQALMKVVETKLVNGVLSREHIEKNARLAAEKSKILARHGLKGATWLLEPMWLPESFHAKHPDARGARCDNPCLALSDYYSPCLDNEEILEHYRESVRRLLELAPELAVLVIGTNDSGAGICWCTGLYPGPNGPEHCKDISMGKRMRRWFESMLTGAADAGKEMEIFFHPVHFGRDETRDTIEKLPQHASVTGDGNFPDAVKELRRRRRLVMGGANPTLVSWCLFPALETPFPYHNLEAMRNLAETRPDVAIVGGMAQPVYGIDTVATMAILSGFRKPPKSFDDIHKRVTGIAKAHAGARLAGALDSAWKEVDQALGLWLLAAKADTNHLLHPQYSVVGDRWLLRPIVPDPSRIPAQEKEYYNAHRHQGRREVRSDHFFIVESTINYKIDEMKWVVATYGEIVGYMDRAMAILERAEKKAQREEEIIRKRFALQRNRIAALRAVWRTQRNVLRCQSIIDFFTGEKKEEYWHVIRKDESFLEPPTYRRLFLEAMDDEIANCREIAKLIRESEVPLIGTGDVETSFVLPRNLPELLEKKIALMEAHKGDIDVVFPNCPPERFTDPTYEWADKRFKGQRRT